MGIFTHQIITLKIMLYFKLVPLFFEINFILDFFFKLKNQCSLLSELI